MTQLHAAEVAAAPAAMAPAREQARLFISYSRADEQAVLRFVEALDRDSGVDVLRDKEDILPAEEWRARLESLIRQADTFCFCLSPDSAASKECGWELDVAIKLNKRIVPVVLRDTPAERIPAAIAKLNFIFSRASDPLDQGIERLRVVLQTDIGWIREHTRLGELAQRWDHDGRQASDILRGRAIESAEKWLATQPHEAPAPTAVQRDFIGASRHAATRRQRGWITGSLIVAALSIGLSILAYWQRNIAVDQRTEANARRLAAEALVALNDVLAAPHTATQNLLASLRLKPNDQARQALKIGMNRLEPLRVAALPWPASGPEPLAGLRFSPSGAWLAGATAKALLIWDVNKHALRVEHALKDGESISKLVFSADGAHLMVLTGAAARTGVAPRILMVDLVQASVTEPRLDDVLDAAEIGGRLLALVAGPAPAQVRAIEPATGHAIWQTTLARPARFGRLMLASQLIAKQWLLPGPAFDIPITIVVLASDDGRVGIWRFDKPEPVHSYSLADGAQVVSFGEGGKAMAVQLAGGSQAVLDVATGKELWRPADPGNGPIRFAGGDRFAIAKDGRVVRFHSLAGGASVQLEDGRRSDYDMNALANVERYSAIIDAQTTDDGEMLATAWKDGRVDIWRPGFKPRFGAIDGTPRANFESVARLDHGDALGVTAPLWTSPAPLFFSPTGRFVASQSMGLRTNAIGGAVAVRPTVRVWDTRHGGEIARFLRPAMRVVFSPRDDLMATVLAPVQAGHPFRLELWSLAAPEPEVRRGHAVLALSTGAAADHATDLKRDLGAGQPVAAAQAVWVGADRKLRMLDAQTRRVVVLDDLAPAAAAAFAEARATVDKLRASVGTAQRSMIDRGRLADDPYAVYASQMRHIAALAPVPLYPVAISGNRRRAVVKLASTLRIYALDERRLLGTTRIDDHIPMSVVYASGLVVPDEIIMSHNGSAIAASVLSLADATRVMTVDWRKFSERDKPLELGRQVLVLSGADNARVATLERKFEVLPIKTPGPSILLVSAWPKTLFFL